jgi:hypothetical protein
VRAGAAVRLTALDALEAVGDLRIAGLLPGPLLVPHRHKESSNEDQHPAEPMLVEPPKFRIEPLVGHQADWPKKS